MTCLFKFFLTLTVITELVLAAAMHEKTSDVLETRKDSSRAVFTSFLTTEAFWSPFAVLFSVFGLVVSTRTDTFPEEVLILCFLCQVRAHQFSIAFHPESSSSSH